MDYEWPLFSMDVSANPSNSEALIVSIVLEAEVGQRPTG
jgi:hypothetical protein